MIEINPSYSSLSSKISKLPQLFESEGETLYKGRNVIKRFVLTDENGDTHTIIVKRYGRMKPLQRLCYSTFFSSKAERAYKYAFTFLDKGIDTPQPIAYIEQRKHGLLYQCFLVTTECSLPDCRFLYEEKKKDSMLVISNVFIQQLSAFIATMHSQGILHGDLNLSNILYSQDAAGAYHFAVIDINRTRFVNTPNRKQCLKNMMRLTHDRTISAAIVGEYARQRGWDSDSCIAYVAHLLDAFERRNDIKHAIFGKTKR